MSVEKRPLFGYNRVMDQKAFYEACAKHGLQLSEQQLSQYAAYAAYLREENEKVNLTAITELPEIYEKHFYDSLLVSFHEELKGSLADIGTGAGFPGVVLKIAYPELQVDLIESNGKRCAFLQRLIEKLSLQDIRVINARSEDFTRKEREVYDYATARAVAELPILMEICAASVKVGGSFLALRGAKGEEEIVNAENARKKLGFRKPLVVKEELPDGSLRILGYYRKEKETPSRYPRLYTEIKKKCL